MIRISFRLGFALLLLPALAPAQQGMPTSPVFQQVLRLAQDGYGDSARATVARIIERTPATDAAYPEALYTAATVARTGEEMRLLFSRVAVEFSASPWADDALLRLAQLEYGAANHDAALARVRRLMNDYPASPLVAHAALWGARAAFERRQFATACEWLGRGVGAAGDDVEIRNQLEFARTRCTAASAPLRDEPVATPPVTTRSGTTARTDTAAPVPPPTTPARSGAWRIQVGALGEAGAIRRAVQQIEQAGFTAYQVPGPNGLTKVQAGPFATREEAAAQLARVKAAVRGDAFVTRAP